MSSYEFIEYEEDDGAGVVSFDRPDMLNAINGTTRAELVDALERAEAAEDVRAVVITGNGRAFSSGYEFGSDDGPAGEELSIDDRILEFEHDYLNAIRHLEIPVIAAVNGLAFAGACNLVLYCDLVYASEEAEFGYPEVHMGSLPGAVIDPFVGVSSMHAKELYFTGKRVDAERAERMGFVNEVIPDEELMDRVREDIEGIKLTPSTTVALSKAILNESQQQQGFRADNPLDHYLWAMSMEVDARKEFQEKVETEGTNAAIDWMHEVEKR